MEHVLGKTTPLHNTSSSDRPNVAQSEDAAAPSTATTGTMAALMWARDKSKGWRKGLGLPRQFVPLWRDASVVESDGVRVASAKDTADEQNHGRLVVLERTNI
eukprot:129684-Prymnesium_polylepis.1